MTLTDTQIDNFVAELENFAPVLERSEVGDTGWPPVLLEDYAEKGNLLELLITINIAVLNEIKALTP